MPAIAKRFPDLAATVCAGGQNNTHQCSGCSWSRVEGFADPGMCEKRGFADPGLCEKNHTHQCSGCSWFRVEGFADPGMCEKALYSLKFQTEGAADIIVLSKTPDGRRCRQYCVP